MTHSRVPIDVYRFLIAYYGGERHAPFVDFLAEHYEGRFASVGAFVDAWVRERLGAHGPLLAAGRCQDSCRVISQGRVAILLPGSGLRQTVGIGSHRRILRDHRSGCLRRAAA